MGLFSFIKDAGEKLLGIGDAKAAQEAAKAEATAEKIAAANKAAGEAIKGYVTKMGLKAENLEIAFDGKTATVMVAGIADTQEIKEKILLCCGNVKGVEKVEDNMTVTNAKADAQFHTVVSGDTLSKIAKQFYGNANAYMKIFEANKPMLSHPDKIYPGQMLRIPPQ
jgi:nucleoid-associated protein YgaU